MYFALMKILQVNKVADKTNNGETVPRVKAIQIIGNRFIDGK